MRGPLILVGNRLRADDLDGAGGSGDLAPRRDYVEIARRLDGTLLGYDLFDAPWYRLTRRIEKRLRLDVVESVFAASQCAIHQAILSSSERSAVPLAVLLSIAGREETHVAIAHKLSSGLKTHLFRIWQFQRAVSHVICVCRAQADYAVRRLGFLESRVDFVYNQVDHRFFRPLKVDIEDYVLAVGQEQRDYVTLLRALSGTGVKLIVVASSPWSTGRVQMGETGEVTVLRRIPYHQLRALYAGARLIVLPLFDVDYAAGATAVLEAMAMAKPLVVSRTRGIIDYVAHGETGMYASPGNAEELAEAVLSLWGQDQERNRLGTNARQAVEERMNLDIYVDQVAEIVRRAVATADQGVLSAS